MTLTDLSITNVKRLFGDFKVKEVSGNSQRKGDLRHHQY